MPCNPIVKHRILVRVLNPSKLPLPCYELERLTDNHFATDDALLDTRCSEPRDILWRHEVVWQYLGFNEQDDLRSVQDLIAFSTSLGLVLIY